ncbi:GNAT family N-acetyltransferase [Alteribacillus bidgolensis]|uniref:Acetyltransferase (GNAT) family protein n=1 Tax=Alteribacillus bidgolensis TaxID=930129 RepID=A0A1G8HBG3_9BACI|nr:GNAT family N-acetyltransferase [Alteribacillus bidgolensis]SDI03830.1 Acetyltransferase (GNAT) family protein [Alteribacillus bidgolensis]
MKIIPFTVEGYYFIKMIELYAAIFKADPKVMKKQFQQHYRYPNFEGYLAVINNQVAGYIYGYTSRRGQYYHHLLANHLLSNDGWLKNCLVLAELGVHPRYRRRGIAKQLIHILLQNRREKTALLTVRRDNHNAVSFYKKQGWVVIRDGFYPNVPYEFLIMGKVLNKVKSIG